MRRALFGEVSYAWSWSGREESLDGVLGERALTITSETREMLVPALAALDYLHKKGYAHSRLRPSNVMAVNDQLKLSTDCICCGE